MVIHASAEDYLEVILVLTERLGLVRSIDIVNELGYSKPSISVAMKKLRENGYIEMDSEGYIRLLPPGMEIAQRIYRRHKLLKSFLISLGVDETTAAEDACKIEHCISEETFLKLAEHVEQDNAN
ncbi:metal-dependent transcriptional regulator [Oscillospiraceae bacterium LTW-04]|nr:metal-dependent transcriptional regulator [Oscillospiraceae bacterium MB24-C1]